MTILFTTQLVNGRLIISGCITCEVNTRPANPDSMAFHERLGFREVGRQQTEGGAKEVALLAWELA